MTPQQWAEKFQAWYEETPDLPRDPLLCWRRFWVANPTTPPYDEMRAALAEFCDWEPLTDTTTPGV